MQPDDALERLMHRPRPNVPPRSPGIESEMTSGATNAEHQYSANNRSLEVNETSYADVRTTERQDAKTAVPELVRTTTRLDADVDKALRNLCLDERITKEIWFEAAYLYLADQPEAMAIVLQIAKERYQQRKRAAELKKLETMQKRLQG